MGVRDLGRKIKQLRVGRLHLSQQEFAEKLGMSRHSTISDWERGAVTPPDFRLYQIAEVFGSTVEELFGMSLSYEAEDGSAIDPSGRMVAYGDDPSIVGRMPDVSFLFPKARAIYDRAVGSYFTRGWPGPIIERAANDLINYIVGANTLRSSGPGKPELTEDEQCMVLDRTTIHVERAYGPNGVVRKF